MDKIIKAIQDLIKKKFTGILTLTIRFNEGGIRRILKKVEHKI